METLIPVQQLVMFCIIALFCSFLRYSNVSSAGDAASDACQ